MKVLSLLCLGVLCGTAWTAEPARLSIPEVLNPETRVRACYDYKMRAEPERMKSAGSAKFEDFAGFHVYAPFTIAEFPGGKDGVHYLVSWQTEHGSSSGEPWPGEKPAPSPELRRPMDGGYQLFASDGKPLSSEIVAFQSVVLDLDGDGVPEVIEQRPLPAASAFEKEKPFTDYELLKVTRLDAEDRPSFILLYNANPSDRLPGNVWGSQIRLRKEGTTEIELGPLRLPEGTEPKVVFRWDNAKRTWVGPERKAGDHWLILPPDGDEFTDWYRVAAKAGLRYPLVEPPEPAADFAQPVSPVGATVAPPYKAQSLSTFSDEQIWSYMTGGRTEADDLAERERAALALPDLWQRDPKSAALAYVRRHRDLETREQYTTTIPSEEAAPEEGELTLANEPLGDGSYIATFHHLHCSADGSFLLRMQMYSGAGNIPIVDWGDHWSVQRLDLSREQARRLFQTVWWMSQVRSLQFHGGQTCGSIHGAYGSAVVTLQSQGKAATFGSRYEMDDGGYGPSSFASLTSLLFEREIPEWLGKAWSALFKPVRLVNREGLPVPQSAEELTQVKSAMAGVLQLFREGKAGRPLAEQAVTAVGEQGWRDLRAAVEQVRDILPPPFPFERRRAEIDAQLKPWKEKLGKDATEWASSMRENRRHPLEPPPASLAPAQEKLTPEEAQKFAGVDVLYRERSDLLWKAPIADQEIASLRTAISVSLRQLDAFDDPEALFRWDPEEGVGFAFAVKRLVQLDPKRAVELLRLAEKATPNENEEHSYGSDRRLLEERIESAAAGAGARLSAGRRAALLESFRDGARLYRERDHALHLLVPPEEPRRYADPEIDAALLESLARTESLEPGDVPEALAQRGGDAAWKELTKRQAFAARVVLAQHDPAQYGTLMRDELAAQLRESKVDSEGIWALWQLDLRELKPDLEKLATGSPDDVEKDPGRFHLARQIAALWNETDPFSRARMLVAFAVGAATQFAEEYNGALERLDGQLAALRSALAPAQLASVLEYLTWCEAADAKRGSNAAPAAELAKVVSRLRAGLGVPR